MRSFGQFSVTTLRASVPCAISSWMPVIATRVMTVRPAAARGPRPLRWLVDSLFFMISSPPGAIRCLNL